jgi:uncharacterized protein (TIRG00374 family)
MTESSSSAKPKSKPINTKQLIWRGLSIVVTVVLLAYLINNIDTSEFRLLLEKVTGISLVGALASYLSLNIFRAIRFRVLLDKSETPLRVLIPITLYHNFLVRLLPFKLGELSYIVLLRNRLNYSMESGVSSLFGARILELLIIVVVFAFGIVLSGEQFAAQRNSLLILVAVIFVGSVVSLYFAGTIIRVMLRVMNSLVNKMTSSPIALVNTINHKLHEMAIEFDRIRNAKLFVSALLITCLTYTTSFMTNYILLTAVGLQREQIGLPIIITIISIGMFTSAFPFSVSGFGIVELGWFFGLTTFAGFSESLAASTGILLHGFQVGAATLYGIIGYALIHMTPPITADEQES